MRVRSKVVINARHPPLAGSSIGGWHQLQPCHPICCYVCLYMGLYQSFGSRCHILTHSSSFKGDESTFLDFPSRLAHNLQETIQNVKVESLVFPAYEVRALPPPLPPPPPPLLSLFFVSPGFRADVIDINVGLQTKGELRDAVERFVEWLQHQVLQREVSHAIELGGESGAAGAAKVVLCGHSMGGLVISDALSSVQLAHNNDGPLWPRIIAVLAFDTPVRTSVSVGLHLIAVYLIPISNRHSNGTIVPRSTPQHVQRPG